MDNIFVERLWRSLKYEEVYLNAYATVAEAKAGMGAWLEGLWMWTIGFATGSASPASRASSESGEMLAFAHIPTGATANRRIDQTGFEGRVTSASTAPEPTSKSAGLNLNKRLRLSRVRGPPQYFIAWGVGLIVCSRCSNWRSCAPQPGNPA